MVLLANTIASKFKNHAIYYITLMLTNLAYFEYFYRYFKKLPENLFILIFISIVGRIFTASTYRKGDIIWTMM